MDEATDPLLGLVRGQAPKGKGHPPHHRSSQSPQAWHCEEASVGSEVRRSEPALRQGWSSQKDCVGKSLLCGGQGPLLGVL